MTHTYCAFGKCSTCSMLHSLHKCEISSKFSNLLHFTNKITHLRIHRTENAMRNYHNYAFSRATRVMCKIYEYIVCIAQIHLITIKDLTSVFEITSTRQFLKTKNLLSASMPPFI